MSYKLPLIDMSVYSAGNSFKISLDSIKQKVAFDPTRAADPSHLRMFNESGSTLAITTDSGTIDDYVPAGSWPTYELDQSTNSINVNVVSVMSNPPLQLLMCTFYEPGEKVPDTPQLGNSPIGGTSKTSSIQTLSNEGNPINQLVLDIGDVNFASLVTIYTDGHGVWGIDQSGVKHAIFSFNTAGNPLQIGQAGDVTEVLGKFTIDQTAIVTGVLTALSVIINTINSQAATNLVYNVPTGQKHSLQVNSVEELAIDATNVTIPNDNLNVTSGHYGKSSGNDVIDAGGASGGTWFYKGPGGAATIAFQPVPGTTDFTIQTDGPHIPSGDSYHFVVGSLSRQNGSGSTSCGAGTTISHGLGVTPALVLATPNIAQAGSATVGIGNVGSSSFQATVGAGSLISWWCLAG